MNTIRIRGNVGKKPEDHQTSNGTAMATFSIADNRKKRGTTGENREDWVPQWWSCIAFGQIAEYILTMVEKGDRLEVTGRLEQQPYIAKDETQKTAYRVVVSTVGAPTRPKGKAQEPQPAPPGQGFNNMGQPDPDEEIPF